VGIGWKIRDSFGPPAWSRRLTRRRRPAPSPDSDDHDGDDDDSDDLESKQWNSETGEWEEK